MIVKGAAESTTFYNCGLILHFNPVNFNLYFFPFVAKAFTKVFL